MKALGLWLAAAFASVSTSPPPQGSETQVEGPPPFEIELPEGCEMSTRGLQMDFEVYDITCAGLPMVGVYVGNFPDTSMPGRFIDTGRRDWPSRLHVWVVSTAADVERAQAIADSVRPVN